jgi:hypothetical protein
VAVELDVVVVVEPDVVGGDRLTIEDSLLILSFRRTPLDHFQLTSSTRKRDAARALPAGSRLAESTPRLPPGTMTQLSDASASFIAILCFSHFPNRVFAQLLHRRIDLIARRAARALPAAPEVICARTDPYRSPWPARLALRRVGRDGAARSAADARTQLALRLVSGSARGASGQKSASAGRERPWRFAPATSIRASWRSRSACATHTAHRARSRIPWR